MRARLFRWSRGSKDASPRTDHDHAAPSTDEQPITVIQDRIHREAVLMFLLYEARLVTVEEIVTNRLAGPPARLEPEIRDGTERAVMDLTGLGVLHVEGRSVYVSRAARETAHLILMEGAGPEFVPIP